MMGERRVDQGSLFYEFSLERHVPADHLLRAIDRGVTLADDPKADLAERLTRSPRRRGRGAPAGR